ncbi:MAG: leucine-rich repeat domain-containing protein [Clostridiales bacterium]|nr:leucine-rich repeat domain-containing protein [Clostridiales bacterium]
MKRSILLILLILSISLILTLSKKEIDEKNHIEINSQTNSFADSEIGYLTDPETDSEADPETDIETGIKNKPEEFVSDSSKARYLTGLDLKSKKGYYYRTDRGEYIETTRFVLYFDEDVEIPINIIEQINLIMDLIEEETGYKFYEKETPSFYNDGIVYEVKRYIENADFLLSNVNPLHQDVEIVVAYSDIKADAYASWLNGTLLRPKHIKILDNGFYTILHELLHVVYYRNGKSMDGAFDEGFAEYYADRIMKKNILFNKGNNIYNSLSDYEFPIDKESMEELYINNKQDSGKYKLGYRLMTYIFDEYGDNAFRKIHDESSGQLASAVYQASTEQVAEIIKEQLSEDFFEEFAIWHNNNRERFGDQDLSIYGDWYIINDVLIKYYGSDSHVIIPDTVTEISTEAFAYNKLLESIEIPESVYYIGDAAFMGCANLKEIRIPNSVYYMGDSVFSDCSSLKKVRLPNDLMQISSYMFERCKSLKKITLPKSVVIIGDHAFSECWYLEEIILPSELEEIGEYAFYNCLRIKEISLPNSVTQISAYAFDSCYDLREIVLPKKLKTIENGMFSSCVYLKIVTIPKGIREIGEFAFSDTDVREITIPNTVTKIGASAFENCANLEKIEIPMSVIDIGGKAFYRCDNINIYVEEGSKAETYARSFGFNYSFID